MAIFGALGDIDVGAISKSISATASDIFVYDTRKDSDGGAWRKRTQHTSWYNETLNTATRGSRRDFPAVAVIVGYNDVDKGLVIYDGDDPDFPMWMVFEHTSFGALNNNNPTYGTNGVAMLNGKLCAAVYNGSSTGGLAIIDFLEDSCYRSHQSTSSYVGYSFRGTKIAPGILNRNFQNTGFDGRLGKYSNWIVDSTANDVAMTVLPNAPIDPSTGLPVPTIAIACGPTNSTGGVSVINDNGTVSNVTPGSSVTFYTVRWIDNTRLYAGSIHISGVIGFRHYILNYPSLTTERIEGHSYDDTGLNWSTGLITGLGGGIFGNKFATIKDGFAVGYGEVYTGLNLINYDSVTNGGMFAYIKSNYNTGWMHGDIKGAWLSDTSTANVTGTELNQYGDFASTTGWGSRSAAWTISGGVASVSSGAGYQLLGLTSGTLTNGRKYAVTVNVTAFTAGRLELSQANSSNIQFNLGSTGAKTLIFTYTGTTGQALGIYGYGDASYSFTIDDLYVRELSEADRSVNNTGLAVYGTLTKTPVETGANLVAYGGFDSPNYLYQPHSSTLSFGTNDFCVSYWYKNIAGDEINIQKNTRGGDGWRIVPGNVAGDVYIVNGNFTAYGALLGISNKDVWNHWVVIRRYNVGWFIYKNGVYTGVISAVSGSNFNEVSPLTVGSNTPTSNLMSLLRISQSIPSPEQILKMYNDEKALFQPNSQCTLYGSSDAVTALAYDDTTKLLHVGTSSGRSDFQGLERINNTTTAVTTAISASNGLIAEQ